MECPVSDVSFITVAVRAALIPDLYLRHPNKPVQHPLALLDTPLDVYANNLIRKLKRDGFCQGKVVGLHPQPLILFPEYDFAAKYHQAKVEGSNQLYRPGG